MDGGKLTTINIPSHTIKIPTFNLNYQSDQPPLHLGSRRGDTLG